MFYENCAKYFELGKTKNLNKQVRTFKINTFLIWFCERVQKNQKYC